MGGTERTTATHSARDAELTRLRHLTDVAADIAFTYRIDTASSEPSMPEWITEQAFEELTGYTVDEWRALGGWPALIHPDDHGIVEARTATLLEAGQALTAEYRIVTKAGGLRWLRVTSRLVEEHGECRVYGAAIDVTDQRVAEQALAASEARLREAQSIAHVGSWHWDVAANRVTWTDELFHIYGLSPETFTPTYEGYVAHVHPDDRAAGAEYLRRTLEEDAPYDHEYRIVRPDGAVRWLFTQAHVVRDPSGAPTAVHGSCWDVTERHESLAAIAQSERDLNEAQAVSSVGSWNVNFVTGDRRWSNEMFRLHGRDPEAGPLLVDDYMDLIHPDDREAAVAAGNRGLATGEPYEFEYRSSVGDQPRWLLGRVAPLVVDGKLVGLRGTVTDITRRKLAEQALAESEARLKDAQAVARLGHWRSDLASGRLEWSDEVYRLFAYDHGSVEPSLDLVIDRVHPDDRAAFEADVATLVTGGAPHEHEFRIILPDGAVRWMHTKARPERDGEGCVIAVVGVSQDVTELRRQDEFHRVVSEMVPDVLFSYNVVNGRLHADWVTPAFERVTGHPVPDPLGASLFSAVLHPEDQTLLEHAERRVLRGEAQQTDLRVLTPAGEVRWLRLFAQPVHDRSGAEVVRVYGAAQDISDQKAVEAALRQAYARERDAAARLRAADRLKDEFISTASHELRTPLTAVVGFASALARGMAKDEAMQADIIAKIERNALALGSMVERLLDFSQLQAGAVHMDPRSISLAEHLGQAAELLGAELDRHQLVVDVPGDLVVYADPTALNHILTNLLTNAARYAPPASRITVCGRNAEGAAYVSVSDEGPGMCQDVAARVFERFYRGPDQPDGQRGSGIGLAIVKSYVDLMGGTISIDTAPDKGTRFDICLPAADRVLV